MIRRLALFALLTTVGVLVLAQLTPDRAVLDPGGGGEEGGSGPFKKDVSAGRGVDLGQIESRGTGIAIRARPSGPLEIPAPERIPFGDGFRMVRTYQLNAADSEPLGDGERLRLVDITVVWYEVGYRDGSDGSPQGEPYEIPAGELRAREGFLAVGRDRQGNPSIREDRDMDLRGVTVRTLPTSRRLEPMEMRVARVRGRQTERGMLLYTPTEEDPFELTLAGSRPARMTGRGMRLSVPPGGVAAGGDARREGVLRLDVRHDPVLSAEGVEVRAGGPLVWQESVGSRGAHVAIENDVRLRVDGAVGGSDADGGPVRFRGSGARFEASLVRGGGRSGAAWRTLVLEGTEEVLAVLRRGDGSELRARRVSASGAQGLGVGEPAFWLAEGDDRGVYLRLPDPEDVQGRGIEFRTERRIRVARLEALHRRIHAAVGAGSLVWPRTFAERFVFEGRTTVDIPSRGLELQSEEDVIAWLGLPERGGASAGAVGRSFTCSTSGPFTCRTERIDAEGTNGFALTRTVDGGERITVGPGGLAAFLASARSERRQPEAGLDDAERQALVDASFSIRRRTPPPADPVDPAPGGADAEGSREPFVIAGHGVCELRRTRTDDREVRVFSPLGDLAARWAGGTLDGVTVLRAAVDDADGLRRVEALAAEPFAFVLQDVGGSPAAGGETIRGRALSIRREGPGALRIVGSPARIERVAAAVGATDARTPADAEAETPVAEPAVGTVATGATPAEVVTGRLEADTIRMVTLGPGRTAVLASDDEFARGRFVSDEGSLEVQAPVLEFLPAGIPEAVFRAHAGSGIASRLFGYAARGARLVARSREPEVGIGAGAPETLQIEGVTMVQRDADGRVAVRATGQRLTALVPRLDEGAERASVVPTGLLSGAPARFETVDADQRFVAIVDSIRFGAARTAGTAGSDGLADPMQRQRFDLVPGDVGGTSRLLVFGFGGGGGAAGTRNMRLDCRGGVAVLPDRIDFAGPIEARSLQDDGRTDPAGLRLDADALDLRRAPDDGRVTHARAERAVEIDYNGVHALADRIDLLIDEQRLVAESAEGPAAHPVDIALEGQGRAVVRRAEVNLRTRAWRLVQGRLVGRRANPETDREPGSEPR